MNGFEGLSTYILRGNDVKQDAYYRQSVEWYSAAGWADVYWQLNWQRILLWIHKILLL